MICSMMMTSIQPTYSINGKLYDDTHLSLALSLALAVDLALDLALSISL